MTTRKPSPIRPSQHPAPSEVSPGETLIKYLVNAGVGPRRHCATLIMEAHVSVNGNAAPSLTQRIHRGDLVRVNGKAIEAGPDRKVYLLLNKPPGYVSTVSDEEGRPTVLDLVPPQHRIPGLVPAGRLDINSAGLTLLTNDGELILRVTHPRYEVQKEYEVTLDKPLSDEDSKALLSGVQIEAGLARAVAVRRLDRYGAHAYGVTLVEGRKREVRFMLRALNHTVLKLRRVRIGNLLVRGIPMGGGRPVTAEELAELKGAVGLGPVPIKQKTARRSRKPGEPPKTGRTAGSSSLGRPSHSGSAPRAASSRRGRTSQGGGSGNGNTRKRTGPNGSTKPSRQPSSATTTARTSREGNERTRATPGGTARSGPRDRRGSGGSGRPGAPPSNRPRR